jgi:hypothetical protein
VTEKFRWREVLASPWCMVLAALLVRLVFMAAMYSGPNRATLERFTFSSETARVARAIASGEGFSSPLPVRTGPTALIPPVYVYLLSGIFGIFGVYTFWSAVALLAVNSVFSALTCVPIFFLTRKWLDPGVAVAAGWMWVFYPNAMYIPVKWVWESTLATLLLSGAVWLGLVIEETPSLRAWLAWGALWGLVTLTSPSLLLVLPLLGGWLCYRLARRGVRWVGPACASMLVLLFCITPWLVRNYRVFGRFIPLRSGFGLELRVGNSPETDVRWRSWLHPNESLPEQRLYQQMGELAYMDAKKREALEFIRANPGTFAQLTWQRISYIWLGMWSPRLSYLFAHAIDFANIPATTLLTVLAFCGLRLAFRQGKTLAWPCALIFLAAPLPYYITHVNIRYRHPMDPFLILLAVFAVAESRKKPMSAGEA